MEELNKTYVELGRIEEFFTLRPKQWYWYIDGYFL
jgi:hypothetical protein